MREEGLGTRLKSSHVGHGYVHWEPLLVAFHGDEIRVHFHGDEIRVQFHGDEIRV